MQETSVDLYRMGNTNSPRMDNVRPQDISIYETIDRLWVMSSSGGISTFSAAGRGKNWWKLSLGTEIPSELILVNDHGNHWVWQPSYNMPLDQYKG
jgi:hypothetical protein